MDQSQTPRDLVQYPGCDGKKILAVLKEKLTREGLDNSKILVKLKEAHDAIERACCACMVTDEVDKQTFWDESVTFFSHYDYWLEHVERTMLEKGFSNDEASDAVMKAERAIFDAIDACTSDTERAELSGIRFFEDVDPECAFKKDKIADLRERLIRRGADESVILMRLKEAEKAIQHVFSVCDFTDKEKQIFRSDIYGKYSADLVRSMLYRLSESGSDAATIKEMCTRANDAICDAQNAFGTCLEGYCEELEVAEPECGFKDRVADFEEKLTCMGVDKSQISVMLEEAEEAIRRVFSVCLFTSKEMMIFRSDIYGDYSGKLLDTLLHRLTKFGYGTRVIEEKWIRACGAIEYAERACGTHIPRPHNRQPIAGVSGHQADEEKDEGSCKRMKTTS